MVKGTTAVILDVTKVKEKRAKGEREVTKIKVLWTDAGVEEEIADDYDPSKDK
jgi:hypothetical protein